MASRHINLKRIGEEGFRMLDQAEEKQRCLYQPTKPSAHYLQPPPVTQVQRTVTPPPPQINYSEHHIQKPSFTLNQTMPSTVTGNTTASHYNPPQRSTDHMTHVAQATTRDQTSAGSAMDCIEAAWTFGGIVVTDYYPNNKKIMMQRRTRAW